MGTGLRVTLFGLGPIGAAVGRLIAEKDNAVIVAAIDADPAKAGRDVGELLGLDRTLGVAVVPDAAAGLAVAADIVVHCTGSYLTSVKEQLIACLSSGHNVVSTCEELAYPLRKHPEISQELDEVARGHGVTLHATGVNPGFVMDKLVLTMSSVCQRVEGAVITRVVDAGRRRLPLQKKVGAGMTEETFRAEVAAGRIKHHGLPESAALIADGWGLPVDSISEVIEPVMATGRVETEYLVVEPGQVAGVRQVCVATNGGAEVLRLVLEMYVGAPDPADVIELRGTPALTLKVPGGTHGDLATAAAVVNAVPLVVSALPGLRTVADLPVRYSASYPAVSGA
ncbi:MAG: dihydrodipicolinate reductase [Candidatus Sericytochromatia bacterium]|nr:dihydrodipicolinate reductase [Candidatus Sericytochromatia bacterium]